MRDEYDQTTATVTSEQEAPRDLGEASPLPSLWGSVYQAFQQARLARLEARLRRLRRYAVSSPVACPQPVVLLAAERGPRHGDSTWRPVFPTGPRRRVALLFVIVLVAFGGVALRQLPLRSDAIPATSALPESQVVAAPSAPEVLRTTVATLEEHVTALRQQLDQQGDHLTNQSSALESVSQQSDTHQTQLTTLADALAALSAQVQQVEQQVTTQATRVAAHEKQLARQATQLGHWREPSAGASVVPIDQKRPGPPTLELLAPPMTTTTAPVAGAPSTGQPPRRTITLPASLGAVGLRTTTKTTGGPQP